ncbi:MAG: carbohydrate kinase family protein [Candidatus Yonathbacteria bacterium]|nr:carbohydrate kinase family protein [Candidatus Yonathbacteria bacterium]
MEQLDFVGIGDTVVDAFIRLREDQAHTTVCKIDANASEICMPFGAKVPYDFVKVVYAVGNSANACVSASRLGLKSALITNLGNDDDGAKCVASLKKDGVSTEYVKQYNDIKTNYHYVLWYGSERTILIKHEVFPYILPQDFVGPKWLYLSSLGETSLDFHHEIATYLAAHPETKLAFQPGTFQIKLGTDALKDLYAHTEVFFCNVEEARLILKTDEPEPKKLARMMTALGPKITVITDGPKGAYVFDGTDVWFMPVYPDIAPPYDRTGAGDSFASTFIAALALGKEPREAVTWAPVNSMSVVQKIGAQEGLLSRAELEKYLAEAPADYKAVKLD